MHCYEVTEWGGLIIRSAKWYDPWNVVSSDKKLKYSGNMKQIRQAFEMKAYQLTVKCMLFLWKALLLLV